MRRYFSIGILLLLCSATVVMAEPVLQPRIQKAGSVFVMHPFENPLTVEDVEQMRTRVIANFKRRFQKPDHPLVFGGFDVPEGAFIVAYGFTIYADGVTAEYVGLTSDSQSVSTIHNNARKWHKETETYTSSGDQVPCSGWWSAAGTGEVTWYDDPYGAVTNDYVLYFCNNDNSSSYDWYAIKHTYEIIPGLLTCGSGWINDYGWSKHRWCDTDLENPLLIDVSPETIQVAEEDPISVHVCLSAPSSGCPDGCWYFTLGSYTIMRNNTDSPQVIARWKMEFTNDEARENIRSMKPGSLCRMDEPSTPGEYKIISLRSVGYFTDGTTTVEVKHIWDIFVEY
jgi:hypothetical protein